MVFDFLIFRAQELFWKKKTKVWSLTFNIPYLQRRTEQWILQPKRKKILKNCVLFKWKFSLFFYSLLYLLRFPWYLKLIFVQEAIYINANNSRFQNYCWNRCKIGIPYSWTWYFKKKNLFFSTRPLQIFLEAFYARLHDTKIDIEKWDFSKKTKYFKSVQTR